MALSRTGQQCFGTPVRSLMPSDTAARNLTQ